MVASQTDSGNIKPEESVPKVHQGHQEESLLIPAPIRQSSVFSLTLDEYQIRSGKSFSSMNLDELLNSIWNGDENVLFPVSNREEPSYDRILTAGDQNHLPGRQGGPFSVPPPLCNKTIDEVWSEINKNKQQGNDGGQAGSSAEGGQQAFGEMTLEDFLVKVGVVQDVFIEEATGSSQRPPAPGARPCPCPCPSRGTFPNSSTNVETTFGIGNMMGLGFPPDPQNSGNDLAKYLSQGNNNKFPGESSKSRMEEKIESAPQAAGGEKGRKRPADDQAHEMAVERRQRRMIKNRESAARSRARKQAYTVELELELNHLKEENTKLKKIVAEAERKRREKVMQQAIEGKEGSGSSTRAQKIARQLKTLRRTVSGP